MQIGEALKLERKRLGLNQTRMAGPILSKSYYSKVERGLFEINASDLIEILNLHGIKATDFFERYEIEGDLELKNRIDELYRKLHMAFYNKNIELARSVRKFCEEHGQQTNLGKLWAQSVLIEANLNNKLDKLNIDTVKKIKNQILDIDYWDLDSLRLLALAMTLFNIDELDYLVLTVLKKYKNTDHPNQEILSAICVNYLAYAYHYSKINDNTMGLVFKFLDALPVEPKNSFAKIMKNYYQALFLGDRNKVNSIIEFLENNDLKAIAQNLEK